MNKAVKQNKKYSTKWMTGTALMVAITVVLAFTPLGIIPLVVLSATTLHIPTIIATLFLGWESGVICGLVFGITSLIKNFHSASLFAPFFKNPLVSIMPRVLFPLAVYGISILVGRFLKKGKLGENVTYVVSSFLGTLIHTTMVMGMIYLLYRTRIEAVLQNGAGVPESIAKNGVGLGIAVMGVTNGLPEALVAAIIAPIVLLALNRAFSGRER